MLYKHIQLRPTSSALQGFLLNNLCAQAIKELNVIYDTHFLKQVTDFKTPDLA